MEEKELVRLSQEGDEQAFALLVKKYEAKVFRLAMSLTQNREVSDDLAQEVFIKAYFSLPKFRFKSEFGTWLYRIAINQIRDHLRKRKSRMKEISLEAMRENLFAQRDEMLREELEQVEEKRRELVHKFLRDLPPKYQIILALRDLQGFSYEEISKTLKLSPGTVDSRLYRARKMLRKKLAPFLSQKGGIHEMQES
jgi:RNA polymerase sigma-70 factor (ECF subfamily)